MHVMRWQTATSTRANAQKTANIMIFLCIHIKGVEASPTGVNAYAEIVGSHTLLHAILQTITQEHETNVPQNVMAKSHVRVIKVICHSLLMLGLHQRHISRGHSFPAHALITKWERLIITNT